MQTASIASSQDEGLRREIGLWGLSSNMINAVVGSGIFVLPAIVSQGLGASGILAYLFCGFLISVIMLCFAEVGSKITVTGGAYAYIEHAFGKFFGFVTTNLFIFGACVMATAAVANALANTLAYLMPIFHEPVFRAAFFVTIFSLLIFVNVLGVKQGITLVKIATIAKLAPLFLLICWGVTEISPANLQWESLPSLDNFGKISLVLFFAFQGGETSLSVSGEVKKPSKTIPKAIMLSLLVIVLLYISIQLVAQGILGDSFDNYMTAPLAEVAQRIMGPFGVTLMIIGASVSMFGYLSGDTLNMPRVLYRSSKDRVIPIKALSLIHPKFATPYVSIITYAVMCCVLSLSAEFKQLAVIASASLLLIYLGVASAVIKLRITDRGKQAGFRIPGGYTVPILAIVTILWFLSNLLPKEMIGITIALAFFSLLYYLIKYFKPKG